MAQVINMSVVDELVSFAADGDPDLLVDLIRMFLEDAPTKVASMRTGLERQDWHMVEKAAHSLKGSSGNLGAELVQHLCEDLQNAARATPPDCAKVTRLVHDLEAPFQASVAELRKILARFAKV